MKCNYRPKTNAVKRVSDVSREKNQDKGNIIEKESPDQADRCVALTFIARKPAGDSQGQHGNTRNATNYNPDWLRERLPHYEGNSYGRKCNQCKTG